MNKIDISIVMPVRNTPQMVLNRTLASIQNQSFQNFECICVDDASDEAGTLSTLKSYEADHAFRMIYNHQKIGAAGARNMGLENSRGKYVIFLDSDDLFDENLLKNLYTEIQNTSAEFCCCQYTIVTADNKERKVGKTFYEESVCEEHKMEWFATAPWCKLYVKDFLISHNIKFQNLSSCNDVAFFGKTMLAATRIAALPNDFLIHYYSGTSFQISDHRDPADLVMAVEEIVGYAQSNHYWNRYTKTSIINYFINNMIGVLRKRKNTEKTRNAFLMAQNFLYRLQDDPVETGKIERSKYLLDYSFNEYWLELIEDYGKQLDANTTALRNVIENSGKELCIWGTGKRGKAFISWCFRNNIPLKVGFDRLNKDTMNAKIIYISEEKVLHSDYLIIASNHSIYCELKQKRVRGSLLDLECFCPI